MFLYSVLSSRSSSETRIRQNSGLVVSGCCLIRNDVWFGKNDFALLQITYWLNIKAPLRLGYWSNLSDRKLTQKVNNILFLLIVTLIKKWLETRKKDKTVPTKLLNGTNMGNYICCGWKQRLQGLYQAKAAKRLHTLRLEARMKLWS